MQDLGAGDAGAVNSVAEERVGDSVGLQRPRWDWVLGARGATGRTGFMPREVGALSSLEQRGTFIWLPF